MNSINDYYKIRNIKIKVLSKIQLEIHYYY